VQRYLRSDIEQNLFTSPAAVAFRKRGIFVDGVKANNVNLKISGGEAFTD
jgi:hypothetical protein